MISTALAAVVMMLLFRLLDVSLDLWTRGETRRSVIEQATATAELLAHDLRSLHPGEQGDLLVDWAPFDVDADGDIDRLWPRLRFVRQASRAELARLAAAALDPELVRQALEQGVAVTDLLEEGQELPEPRSSGLLAVVWAVLPVGGSADGRAEGVAVRGEELLPPGSLGTFFEDSYFSGGGRPRAGTTREVTGGVLWLGVQLASQTSIVWDGWSIGADLRDTTASWDAWGLGRPDPEVHGWNEPAAGMPAADRLPLLPRRVRLELEFESERDRRRRTRLAEPLDKQDASFEVDNGEALPNRGEGYVLIDAEWMRVRSVRGDRVTVERGLRGSSPDLHEEGAMVHWGEAVTVEIPIATHRDDWNLGVSR